MFILGFLLITVQFFPQGGAANSKSLRCFGLIHIFFSEYNFNNLLFDLVQGTGQIQRGRILGPGRLFGLVSDGGQKTGHLAASDNLGFGGQSQLLYGAVELVNSVGPGKIPQQPHSFLVNAGNLNREFLVDLIEKNPNNVGDIQTSFRNAGKWQADSR